MATRTSQLSGDELKTEIIRVRDQTDGIVSTLCELVPPGHSVKVGTKTYPRAELLKTQKAISQQMTKLANSACKSAKRKHPQTASDLQKTRKTGGLKEPFLYNQEFVNFLLSFPIGHVDPANPKSQTINDCLKKTAFEKGVATSYTMARLWTLIANNVPGLKVNGKIKLPLDVVQKKMPTAYAALKDTINFADGMDWLDHSRVAAVNMVRKSTLTEQQKEIIKSHRDSAMDIDAKIKAAYTLYKVTWDAKKPKPEKKTKAAAAAAPAEASTSAATAAPAVAAKAKAAAAAAPASKTAKSPKK